MTLLLRSLSSWEAFQAALWMIITCPQCPEHRPPSLVSHQTSRKLSAQLHSFHVALTPGPHGETVNRLYCLEEALCPSAVKPPVHLGCGRGPSLPASVWTPRRQLAIFHLWRRYHKMQWHLRPHLAFYSNGFWGMGSGLPDQCNRTLGKNDDFRVEKRNVPVS